MVREVESENYEDSAAASGAPDPWPPRDSSPEDVNRLVQQEMSHLKALKRLSIGSTFASPGDPDLPDFDSEAEFDVDANGEPVSFVRKASITKQRSIRRERSVPTTRRERRKHSQPFLVDSSSQPLSGEGEDAGAGAGAEVGPSLDNIWVPAGVHPELAPNEWRTFVNDKLAEIKNSHEQQLQSRGPKHQSRLSHEVADLEEYVDAAAILDRRRRSASAGEKRRSILELSRDFVGEPEEDLGGHERVPRAPHLPERAAEQLADAFQPPDLRPLGGATSLRRSTHRMRRPPSRGRAEPKQSPQAPAHYTPLSPKHSPPKSAASLPEARRQRSKQLGRPPLSVSISAAKAVATTAEQPPSPSAATPSPSASTMLGYRRRRLDGDVREIASSQRQLSPEPPRDVPERDPSRPPLSSVISSAGAPANPRAQSSSPSDSDSDKESSARTSSNAARYDQIDPSGAAEAVLSHERSVTGDSNEHRSVGKTARTSPTSPPSVQVPANQAGGITPQAASQQRAPPHSAQSTYVERSRNLSQQKPPANAAPPGHPPPQSAPSTQPAAAFSPVPPLEKAKEPEKVERRWRWLDGGNSAAKDAAGKDNEAAKEPKPARQKEGLTFANLFKKRDSKRDSKREREQHQKQEQEQEQAREQERERAQEQAQELDRERKRDRERGREKDRSRDRQFDARTSTPLAGRGSALTHSEVSSGSEPHTHPDAQAAARHDGTSLEVTAPRRPRGHVRADSRISNRIAKDSDDARKPQTVRARGQRKTAALKHVDMPAPAVQPEIKLPYDIPAHQISDRSYVMMYHRFPLHIERAIYRLSHMKLANPRRPLRQQVLLSNFMYAYLNLINYGYQQQQLQQFYEQQHEHPTSEGFGGHLEAEQLEQLKRIETKNYDEAMYNSPEGDNDESSSSSEDETDAAMDAAADDGDESTYLFKTA